jgi:hypothetical protein
MVKFPGGAWRTSLLRRNNRFFLRENVVQWKGK